MKQAPQYGVDDASFKAAGGLEGLSNLVNMFYDNMELIPEAQAIRKMHPSDLTQSRTKLIYFLSGWLGGPKMYAKNFGQINIPSAHKHLPVGLEEREAWILCMQKAVDQQPYDDSFKTYLITQLRVPAERIRQVCSGEG